MLKPNEKCLKCKQITNYFRKIVTTDKMYILRKMSLKFQNSKSDISYAKSSFVYFLL